MALTAVKGQKTCFEAGRNRIAKESENGPAIVRQVDVAGDVDEVVQDTILCSIKCYIKFFSPLHISASCSTFTQQRLETVESVSNLQRSLGLQETRTRIAFLENEQAELETEIRSVDRRGNSLLINVTRVPFQIAEEQG